MFYYSIRPLAIELNQDRLPPNVVPTCLSFLATLALHDLIGPQRVQLWVPGLVIGFVVAAVATDRVSARNRAQSTLVKSGTE